MADEKRESRDPFTEGIRAGFGILGALKEALEETFDQAMNEHEFGPDRARDAFKQAMHRAQDVLDDARLRFDFVPRREFEVLRADQEALRAQLAAVRADCDALRAQLEVTRAELAAFGREGDA